MTNGAIVRTTNYFPTFETENSALKRITTAEGQAVPMGEKGFEYQYFLKDHLGSTRVVLSQTGRILQQNSYYPFGMLMSGLPATNNYTANKYLYNGKELQDEFGLDWYDYGARFYDPELGRWFAVDNKTEKYFSITQYAYAINNPIRFLDPDGDEIVDTKGNKITYSKDNGWSKNATNDIKVIRSVLMETKTGTEQWNKAYSSSSKIEINIVDEKLYSKKGRPALGQTNQALGFDVETARVVKTDNVMKIKISMGNIKESFDGDNKGLTLRQAVAATAGHEIEHTTEENRDIGVQNRNFPGINDTRIEKKPEKVEAKIQAESRLLKVHKIEPKTINVVNNK